MALRLQSERRAALLVIIAKLLAFKADAKLTELYKVHCENSGISHSRWARIANENLFVSKDAALRFTCAAAAGRE